MSDLNRTVREDITETPDGTSVVRTDRSTEVTGGAIDDPTGTRSASVMRTRERTTVIPTKAEQHTRTLSQVRNIIYFIVSIISVLILGRFILLMLGANETNGFAHFVYSVSYPLVAPFLGLFGRSMEYGASYFEFEDLIAIAVYALVGSGLYKLVQLILHPADETHYSSM